MDVYVDGSIVDASGATIPARDSGFLLGDAAAADLRAFGGSVFAREEYLSRLRETCQRLGIAAPEALPEAIQETLRANDLRDAGLRVTVSGGEDPTAGLDLATRSDDARDPTVVVAPVAMPRGGVDGDAPWEGAASLQTVKVRWPSARAVPSGTVASGLPALLARRELVEGNDEALVRGPDGSVAGGARSDLAFVADDGLHVPAERPPGVVQEMAVEFAREADVPVHESAVDPEDVRSAEEAFLTGALWGVRPVGSVDGIPVDGGPVTDLVSRQFREHVEAEHY